jgi:hypothetical protein
VAAPVAGKPARIALCATFDRSRTSRELCTEPVAARRRDDQPALEIMGIRLCMARASEQEGSVSVNRWLTS